MGQYVDDYPGYQSKTIIKVLRPFLIFWTKCWFLTLSVLHGWNSIHMITIFSCTLLGVCINLLHSVHNIWRKIKRNTVLAKLWLIEICTISMYLCMLLQLSAIKIETYVRSTLGFLAEIYFTPLLYHPGGCLGCPEKRSSSRNYNLFVWSAVFQPKCNDIQKSYKNYQNPLKSYCFGDIFRVCSIFAGKQRPKPITQN